MTKTVFFLVIFSFLTNSIARAQYLAYDDYMEDKSDTLIHALIQVQKDTAVQQYIVQTHQDDIKPPVKLVKKRKHKHKKCHHYTYTSVPLKSSEELKIIEEQNKKIDEIMKKLEKNENTNLHDRRKAVAQAIGYTTGTVGIIRSLWSISVRKFGLKNKIEGLESRFSTKSKIEQQIKVLEQRPMTEDNVFQLNSKIEILSDLNQKIGIDQAAVKNAKDECNNMRQHTHQHTMRSTA